MYCVIANYIIFIYTNNIQRVSVFVFVETGWLVEEGIQTQIVQKQAQLYPFNIALPLNNLLHDMISRYKIDINFLGWVKI